MGRARGSRKRSWCVTSYSTPVPPWWNFEESRPACPKHEGAKDDCCPDEAVFQLEECPSTSRKHWQCFFRWKQPRSFTQVKEWLSDNSRTEAAKGSPQQASAYCSKAESRSTDENAGPHFYGRDQTTRCGKRTDIAEAYEWLRTQLSSRDRGSCQEAGALSPNNQDSGGLSLERLFADQFPSVWCKYPHLLSRVQRTHVPRRPVRELPQRECVYVFGPSGTGKSLWTRTQCESLEPDYYDKAPCCKWFDGYHGQKVALFEDYRGSWLSFSMLLRITDPAGYPVLVETKGGTVLWTATTLYFSSNVPLECLYPAIDAAPLKRRFARYLTLTKRGEDPRPYEAA